ncbi:MAG: zinc ribbon domain-containing protein [Ktedonobacteraceae bacterium]|nr:zinc ribbon domain-containing protein [Ktedonobacteraceae bacterium]
MQSTTGTKPEECLDQGRRGSHGLVHCGECGHKMVVQYKGGTRYLCNFLRQKYHVPVCQHIPGDAVDPHIVEAFFQALSPMELDVYSRAVACQQETIEKARSCPLSALGAPTV